MFQRQMPDLKRMSKCEMSYRRADQRVRWESTDRFCISCVVEFQHGDRRGMALSMIGPTPEALTDAKEWLKRAGINAKAASVLVKQNDPDLRV